MPSYQMVSVLVLTVSTMVPLFAANQVACPTDSYAEINYKIRSTEAGDTISFTTGTFNLKGPIILRSGIVVLGAALDGNGNPTSILRKDVAGDYHPPDYFLWPSNNPDHRAEVSVWNGTGWVDCPHTSSVSTCGQYPLIGQPNGLANVNNVTISRLGLQGKDSTDGDIDSLVSESLLKLNGDSNTIQFCSLKHSVYAGIEGFGNGWIVRRNKVRNTAADGILLWNAWNCKIDSNRVEETRDNSIAIDCDAAHDLCGRGSRILGDTIDNDPLFYPHNADGDIIGLRKDSSDHKKYNSHSIWVGSSSLGRVDSVNILGNLVKNSWTAAIKVEHHTNNVLVKDNTIVKMNAGAPASGYSDVVVVASSYAAALNIDFVHNTYDSSYSNKVKLMEGAMNVSFTNFRFNGSPLRAKEILAIPGDIVDYTPDATDLHPVAKDWMACIDAPAMSAIYPDPIILCHLP